jgi:hypothetical protein
MDQRESRRGTALSGPPYPASNPSYHAGMAQASPGYPAQPGEGQFLRPVRRECSLDQLVCGPTPCRKPVAATEATEEQWQYGR